jgi:hypothetical protein
LPRHIPGSDYAMQTAVKSMKHRGYVGQVGPGCVSH